MSIGKEWFLERYGSMRAGESKDQLAARMADIDRTQELLFSGTLVGDEIDEVQRQLCALKGIPFDDEEWD